MLDITEDAVRAGAKEGDVTDFVTEEDTEEGVTEFMHHRPRRGQPDMNLFAHKPGGADTNRRRQKVHRRGYEQDRAEKEQQLFSADHQGLTAVEGR